MTTDAKAAAGDGVHRLIDMVVEEVSLVDRAANKHRFLIVKRNDAMDDDTDLAAKASPEPNTTGDTEDETESTEEATKQDPPMVLADGSALGAAVAALESLTAIVELLGSLGAERSDTRLAALAQQLRSTAEQILERSGFTGAPPSEGAASADKSAPEGGTADDTANTKAEPADGNDAAHSVFANDVMAAKQALSRLAELAASAAPGGTEKRTSAASDTDAAPSPAESLAKLSESFRTLSALVQDQQQRLGRVEKQFGLPNSAAPAEQVSKAAVKDVGWPLDLNKPMDRENVDKAVSFHDP